MLEPLSDALVRRTAFIHDARGIHAQVGEAPAYAVTDGLGSVRAWTSAAVPEAFITYDPYGSPDTDITGFAFTGEPRDATGLQYHRARYYDPALGAWASLDQLETPNRYAYVDGNVVNWTDPSGYCWGNPSASPVEQAFCLAAWNGYTHEITNMYPQSWPRDVSTLVSSDADCLHRMSYPEFQSVWNNNSSYPPGAICSDTDDYLQAIAPPWWLIAIAAVDPSPAGEAAVGGWLLVGGTAVVCVIAIDAIVDALNSDAVVLPQRPEFDFAYMASVAGSVPVPYVIDEVIPDEYNLRIDVALGINQYLLPFAMSFSDAPTVPYWNWPTRIIQDKWVFTSSVPREIAQSVMINLRVWQSIPSIRGYIKFNLQDLDEVDEFGNMHATTLYELKLLMESADLLAVTRFYRWKGTLPGLISPEELTPDQLADELEDIVPLLGRL
jgi:RHS repeat-associated protein